MRTPISTCDMNRKWVRTYGPGHQKKKYVFQAKGVGGGVEVTGKALLEWEVSWGCPAGIQSHSMGE